MTMKERTYKGIITVYISHPTSVEQLSAVERAVYNALDSGDFDNNEYDIALDILSSDSMSVSDMSIDQEIGIKRAKQKLRDAEEKAERIIKEHKDLEAQRKSISDIEDKVLKPAGKRENNVFFITTEPDRHDILLNDEKIGVLKYGLGKTVRVVFYSNCKHPRLHCTEYKTFYDAKEALIEFYKLNHR